MKKNFLNNKEFIFIDFDGTIKQSDDVKAKAFIKIFENKINDRQKKRIANHHYENLGVSRFVKIPLYLKWSGIKQTKKNTVKYINCSTFLSFGGNNGSFLSFPICDNIRIALPNT